MAESERFPIGFFNCRTLEWEGVKAVKDWDDAGMTVAIGPSYDPRKDDPRKLIEVLDEAQARNIRVILSDTRSDWRQTLKDGFEKYSAGFREAAEEFGSHPATFGFFVGDEPDKHEFENFCKAFRMQKEIAPQLTPYGNLLPCFTGTESRVGYTDWNAYIDEFVAKADPEIISYDCYTQMFFKKNGLDDYFQNLRIYGDSARKHGVPWWTYLLCTGHYNYRVPNENELRWQLNTAAAHGANGIMWFIFYNLPLYDDFRGSPIDEHGARTEMFDWLSRTNKIFLKGHGAWLNKLRYKRSWHTDTAYGGFPLFTGNELVRRVTSSNMTPLIISEFADDDGGKYLAVVNNSSETPSQVDIRVCGKRPKLYAAGWNKYGYEPMPFDQPAAETASGEDFVSCRSWMMPGQLDLFKIIETKPVEAE